MFHPLKRVDDPVKRVPATAALGDTNLMTPLPHVFVYLAAAALVAALVVVGFAFLDSRRRPSC